MAEAFGAQMPEAINALAGARPGLTSAQALADVNALAIQAIGEKAIQRVPQETLAAQQAQEAARAQRIGQIAGTPATILQRLNKRVRDSRSYCDTQTAFKQAAPDIS